MARLHAGTELPSALLPGQSQPLGHTPVTLRLRLTFWYSAVLAVIITMFGMAVYGITTFTLTTQIDTSLRDTANLVGSRLASVTVHALQGLAIPPLDRFAGRRTYVEVW